MTRIIGCNRDLQPQALLRYSHAPLESQEIVVALKSCQNCISSCTKTCRVLSLNRSKIEHLKTGFLDIRDATITPPKKTLTRHVVHPLHLFFAIFGLCLVKTLTIFDEQLWERVNLLMVAMCWFSH